MKNLLENKKQSYIALAIATTLFIFLLRASQNQFEHGISGILIAGLFGQALGFFLTVALLMRFISMRAGWIGFCIVCLALIANAGYLS